MMKFLFLTTSLGKKLILPMFQPDALVLCGAVTLKKTIFLPSDVVRKREYSNFHVVYVTGYEKTRHMGYFMKI